MILTGTPWSSSEATYTNLVWGKLSIHYVLDNLHHMSALKLHHDQEYCPKQLHTLLSVFCNHNARMVRNQSNNSYHVGFRSWNSNNSLAAALSRYWIYSCTTEPVSRYINGPSWTPHSGKEHIRCSFLRGIAGSGGPSASRTIYVARWTIS